MRNNNVAVARVAVSMLAPHQRSRLVPIMGDGSHLSRDVHRIRCVFGRHEAGLSDNLPAVR